MADGFEAFHVPQQSRRDKLRVLAAQSHHHHHHHQDDGFPPPLYDPPPPPPSLVPSEFLSCAALLHHHQQPLGVVSDHDKTDKVASFETNFHAPSLYMDPQLHLSQELSRNPFLFAPQNLRFLDTDSFPGGGGGGGGGGEALSVGGGGGGSGQGLSLTLSSHHHAHRSSSSSSSQLPPLELNLQRYDASMQQQQTLGGSAGIHGGGDGDLSRGYCSSSVPSPAGGTGGPFTGYASILKGSSSRFLRPAQQLLEEACDVVRGTPIYPDDDDDDVVDDANDDGCRLESSAHDSAAALMEPPPTLHQLDDSQGVVNDGGGELKRKKSRLISMLDEVYRRYRQYYQQLQAVIASFESVSGLNNAAPFANLALKAMSKHFRCLKEAITEQLHFAAKSQQGHMNSFEVEASPTTVDNPGKGFYSFQSPTARSMGLMEHPPVWRPQRGLPERAVTVLRAWLFDHFLHPYPTDTDKLMLAKQTGLSRNQVSNWFINARVRLWKPMVEEIHNLETRQAQKNSQKREQSNKNQSEHSSMRNNNAMPCEDANISAMHHLQGQDHLHHHHQQQQNMLSSKRTRDEADDDDEDHNSMGGRGDGGVHELGAMELSSSSYGGNMSRMGFGPTTAGGVSLTLGLHQNNELGLSGPSDPSFPVNAAQRFGLDATSSQGFVVSGFDAHNSQFGRGMIG